MDWKYVDAKYVRIDGATISKPIFNMILEPSLARPPLR